MSNSTKSLERIVRGFSCHRRIQILELLGTSASAMTLIGIAKQCRTKIHPICEHLRRLFAAGLISKQQQGRSVMHELTPLGRKVLMFLKTLE